MKRQYFSDDSFHVWKAEEMREIIEAFHIYPFEVSMREEKSHIYDQSALILRMFGLPVSLESIIKVNSILETLKVVETAESAMRKSQQLEFELKEFRVNDTQKN
jgi:hypothetical protein